jgi:hypothetical protein
MFYKASIGYGLGRITKQRSSSEQLFVRSAADLEMHEDELSTTIEMYEDELPTRVETQGDELLIGI